jgi:WD40 repeat protein
MSIKVERAFDCYVSQGRLFCACSDGVMRIFKTGNLEHIMTMSRPPPLGDTNTLVGVQKIKIPTSGKSKYADIMACAVDELNNRVVAVYSDRMMFVWDISDLKKISVYRTFLSHCAPIHDIQTIPNYLALGTLPDKNDTSIT